MNRINIPNNSYADCPIRMILSRISDKWSILTLFTLTQAPVMRFNELQKTIPDISQKMLTVTLRTLEEDGLVKRQKSYVSTTTYRLFNFVGTGKYGRYNQ